MKNNVRNAEIFSDDLLLIRRYASTNKSRKDWKCNRCGGLVPKGGAIEHSYSADRKSCYTLCLQCVAELTAKPEEY